VKTGVTLFLSSMIFGLIISSVYWIVSREPAGTLLLGVMAVALAFVATYIVLAERGANLQGDHPDAAPGDGAGERVGGFIASSQWPLLLAISVLLALAGAAIGTGVTIFGAVCALLILWGLVLESR
jgi:hypothetical protein